MPQGQAARPAARKNTLGSFLGEVGDRLNEVDRKKQELLHLGRQIYESRIRDNLPVTARTTADLIELGARQANKVASNTVKFAADAAHAAADPHAESSQRFIRGVEGNVVAAGHGAGDAFTFGLADNASAGIRALAKSGGNLHKIRALYDENIAGERAQDAYEAEHYGLARTVGEIAGTVAQAAVPTGGLLTIGARAAAPVLRAGRVMAPVAARARQVVAPLTSRVGEILAPHLEPIEDAAAYAGRLIDRPRTVGLKGASGAVEATPVNGSEFIRMTGAGAGMGVANQAVSDIASGHFSGLKDYGIAGVGGALESIGARRFDPGIVGGLGGAGTSIAQDAADGRDPSLATALGAGVGAGMVGHAAGRAGTKWADSLAPWQKGRLGEALSRVRTNLRGEINVTGPHRQPLKNGGYTVPDGYIEIDGQPGLFESKFNGGELTRRQQQALGEFNNNYRIDNFRSRDIGALAGPPIGNLMGKLAAENLRRDQELNSGLTRR